MVRWLEAFCEKRAPGNLAALDDALHKLEREQLPLGLHETNHREHSAPVPPTSRAGQIRSGLRYHLADGGHLEDPAIAVWEGRGRGCQAQTAVLPL